MADYGKNNNVPNVPKKADVIIQTEREISYKIDRLFAQTSANASAIRGDCNAVMQKCDDVIKACTGANNNVNFSAAQMTQIYEKLSKEVASVKEEVKYIASQNTTICEKLLAEHQALKQEIKYVSAQSECVYDGLAKAIAQLSEKMESVVTAQGEKFAELAAENAEKICALAKSNEEKLNAISEKFDSLFAYDEEDEAVEVEEEVVPVEIDYDELAKKVADAITVPEVSADYIASKVAEQLVVPEAIDEEALCEKVADKVIEKLDIVDESEIEEAEFEEVEPATIDYDELAKKVAEQIVIPESIDEGVLAAALVAKMALPEVDEEKLADAVVAKIAIPEVDEEKLAKAVVDKLEIVEVDEHKIASTVADHLSDKLPANEEGSSDDDVNVIAPVLAGGASACDIDVDELADQIAKKIAATQSDEFDVIVDDAGCESLCNGIANKLDYDLLAAKLAEKVAASQEEKELDVVLDEGALDKITEDVLKNTDERFNSVDKELDEIKGLIVAGAVVGVGADIAVAAVTAEEEAPVEEAEEELVTVSDIVEVEEESEEVEEADVIDEIVEDIDEQPADGEVLPDGIEGISSSAVDFGNMMKYNRSFIARIIQGSDDVKKYYGQTKDALLSYKKVNSNIAWGAERFNKGRETIAKFKIRGKTLCLYLALDPNEYKKSVYHHSDVSNNKSMASTPLMVKIKSPLGVKKAVRLIDDLLEKRGGIKQNVRERDYVAMYPYETIEELIEDGLVKDVSKNK
ncbi:MAG: hypothetical protein J6B04_01575 [Clostridia bacterium]|nr:hypothetical protein [Clostridia bacterium]